LAEPTRYALRASLALLAALAVYALALILLVTPQLAFP
jgi:hypothetical protein